MRSPTPSRAAASTAPATVAGMSWYLRSRKTRPPRFRIISTAAGPAAVKSTLPTLKCDATPPRRATSASAAARSGVSSATISRSRAARVAVPPGALTA